MADTFRPETELRGKLHSASERLASVVKTYRKLETVLKFHQSIRRNAIEIQILGNKNNNDNEGTSPVGFA